MPNVLPAFKARRVVIFTNDHLPPHVHVIGKEEHARFELHCDLGYLKVMSNIGFRLGQLKQIERYLVRHLAHLCAEWGRIHGQ